MPKRSLIESCLPHVVADSEAIATEWRRLFRPRSLGTGEGQV
jgi:hypothetical protein